MKHITEKWEQNIHESAIWDFYFQDLRIGVLDIETTGLNPARNKFVLGCLYDVSERTLHQVLAQSRAEEPVALAEYMKVLEDIDVVVTYNGRHFDMPFFDRRLTANRSNLNLSCGHVYDLDLYLVLNGHSPIKKLVPNMKQKTIENYMGLWDTRADEISGAESVELFNHYEATGDPAAEAKILLHNNDDVRQLTRLTKAVTKSDFHKAMAKLGFPVKCGDTLLTVCKSRTEGESLVVTGIQNKSPINYVGFEVDGWPASCRFEKGRGKDPASFELKVPVIRQNGLAVVDLQEAGLEKEGCTGFADYPGCGSGFLIIEDRDGLKYRETNHFIKAFIGRLFEEVI